MPDESDLKNLFSDASAPNTLDAETIIAKARARRAPRQVIAGLGGTLAVIGIFAVGINTLQLPPQPGAVSTLEQATDSASDTSAGSAPEAESSIKRAPADRINLCGGPLTEATPSFYGLQLDVEFPSTAPVGTAPIAGTVRLTNTSAQPVAGLTGSTPAITLSQQGVVLWHSNGPVDASAVSFDLAPGESVDYSTFFTPVKCEVEDDAAEMFRQDLPALPPGAYELSAAIDFIADPSMLTNGTPDLDLVTGPRSPIALG